MKSLNTALLVEPDLLFRGALKKVLEKEGFLVHEATSLREALMTARKIPVSLITTELMLSDIQGTEIIHRLREVAQNTIIIALTAYTELIPESGLQRYDNVIFMRKPIGMKEFLDTISGRVENSTLR